MATFPIRDEGGLDEIKIYQTGLYISSNEAIRRIFGLEIHHRYPTVVNLAVYRENWQIVYFTEDTAHNLVQTSPETTLTAIFKLFQQDLFAKFLMYVEVPLYYTWIKQKSWIWRKQGKTVQGYEVKVSDAIGRVYNAHPNNWEYFYIRLFLYTVRGSTSFENLRRFQGTVHNRPRNM